MSTPDPAAVKAGDRLTIQIVLINTGAETWDAGSYLVEAEIFNSRSKLMAKTPPLKGNVQAAPGELLILYLPYDVPQEFTGKSYYVPRIIRQDRLLAFGQMTEFEIIPLYSAATDTTPDSAEKPSAPEIDMKGNVSVSYKQSPRTDYLYNFNVNLIGQVGGKPVTANAYVDANRTDRLKIDRMLMTYVDDGWSASAGNVRSDFSRFSLSGLLMQGGLLEINPGSFTATFIGGRAAAPKEGTATSPGSYAQYVVGGKWAHPVKEGEFELEPGFASIYAFDDGLSIATPGPSVTPMNNWAASGFVAASWAGKVKLGGEYSRSFYNPNTAIPGYAGDQAYLLTSAVNLGAVLLNAGYQQVGPEFLSKGSPSSGKDKEIYDASTQITVPGSSTNVSVSYSQTRDNLRQNPSLLSSTVTAIGTVANLAMVSGWPALRVGYNVNAMVSSNPSLVQNNTDSWLVGLNYSAGPLTTSVNYQRSDFTDKTPRAAHLATDGANARVSTFLLPTVSVAGGTAVSSVKSLLDGKLTRSWSSDLGATGQIIPEQLNASVWASLTKRNDSTGSLDTTQLNGTLEVNAAIIERTNFSLGFSRTDFSDAKKASNGYGDTLVSARVNYTF